MTGKKSPMTPSATGQVMMGIPYVWEAGRQLKRMTKDGSTIDYKYDDSGIRQSKTVNGVTTNFTTIGGKITSQNDGTDSLYFRYDKDESLIGVQVNGVEYLYIKNLQGDIISIIDYDGNIVVNYTYDSFGKVVSMTGTLADTIGQLNPMRYRGYYYDSETGLYYLQSRYYDVEMQRFINADDTSVLQLSKEEAMGNNLFAYCGNNPVMNVDPSGYMSLTSVLGKVGEILGKVVNMFTNYLKTLIIYNRSRGTISISTTVIAVTIDAIIASIINGFIYRGVKFGMGLMLRNQGVRNSFVGGMFKFFLEKSSGKFVLWTIVRIGLMVAGRAGATSTVVDGLVKDFLANIAISKSLIMQRSSSLISAFSSVGGIVALFLDLMGRKWDNYATLKV